MAFLNDKITKIAQPAELSLFTVPPNQVAVEKIYYSECRPVSSFNTEDSPVEIFIPGNGNEYLDLRRSRFYVKCKIVKADGTATIADENVGPINLLLQSMWSQIDTYMNGKLVSLNTNHYPWKAYLKVILSCNKDTIDSQLKSQLFFLDVVDLDDPKIVGGFNTGLLQRNEYTKLSQVFDLEGPLYEDVFAMENYLVNGVDLHIKLFKNRTAFLLMSSEANPSYKLELLDVAFKACMVRVDSGVLINHAEILKETTAKYPITRTEIKMNTIASGSGSFIWQNVWSNNLPSKAYFTFVSQSSVNGSYTKNPFNFQHLVAEMALYVNGESVPARPMKMSGDNYVTPFVNLFDTSEKWNKNEGLLVNRKNFKKGFAIYTFSIAPNDLGEQYIDLIRQGSVRLEVTFTTNTTETLNCLAFAEFPALLEVDHSRDIKLTQI